MGMMRERLPPVVGRQVYPPDLWTEQSAGKG
jgi:hypothetical protein